MKLAVVLAVAAAAVVVVPTASTQRATEAQAILYSRPGTLDDQCGSIWSVDPNGTEPTAVIDRTNGDCDPDWSPDGRRFAFASTRAGDPSIFTADASGGNVVRITRPPRAAKDYMPAWSPDGKRIAFERLNPAGNSYALYVVDVNGTHLRRLASGHGFDGTPTWAPDGRRILFVSDRPHGQRRLCLDCAALYVVELTSGKTKRITSARYNALMPSWSRDGTYIAWSRASSIDSQFMSLYVMRANTTGVRLLDGIGTDAAWSPDSRALVYTSKDGLWVITVDGRTRTQLTHDGGSGPSWRPSVGS